MFEYESLCFSVDDASRGSILWQQKHGRDVEEKGKQKKYKKYEKYGNFFIFIYVGVGYSLYFCDPRWIYLSEPK